MKRIALTLIAILLVAYQLFSQDSIVIIPDTAFLHALIEKGVDVNKDSLISYTEAEAVNSLIIDTRGGYACVENNNISSLVGIEAFINLDTLLCTCGKVEDLDLSGNQKLKYLNCSENNLRNLNVSSNTMLSELHCGLNQLTNLDLSNNLKLQKLDCWANDLSAIDVSNNVNLTFLDISANQIKELDVSNNIALTELRCESNKLNTLDITHNTLLTGLFCGSNEIASLDIKNNTLLTYMWLVGMPFLNEVCVWEIPFPPAGVEVNRYQTPNIRYTTECATGIEKRDGFNVSIFPNPTMNLLTVETSTSNQYHFEITSLNSQILFREAMEGSTHQLDLSLFPKGVYFITIKSEDFITTEKIIKL